MVVRRFLAVILAAVLVVTLVASVEAGKYNDAGNKGLRPVWLKASTYDFGREHRGTAGIEPSIPLSDVYSSIGISPGVAVGGTFYDQQQNCTMGRMIETGPHSGVSGPTMVHFGWMYMPDSLFTNRSYAYNVYDAGGTGFGGVVIVSDPDEYAGYVNVDVTRDNRGVVGGHAEAKGPVPYMPQIYFDACSGCATFSTVIRLPDELGEYSSDCSAEFMWPRFFVQYGSSGIDTVLHVVAMSDCLQTGQMTVAYFRYLGYEGQGTWDPVPFIVDTVETVSADVSGEKDGDRVVISWFSNTSYTECDTCSGPAPSAYAGTALAQMDNDVYFQTSNDQGDTWEPRVNITKNQPGEAQWKAYCSSSMLIDQSGYLHVVWVSAWWDEDPLADATFPNGGGVQWYTRLFHWSENAPYIRTICEHYYEPGDCTPPLWAMHVDKPSLSECNGNLYCIYTQFNDIPHGIDDDCAAWAVWQPFGAANGDLWVSGSPDGGMVWSLPYNLTNSYTPGCDPSNGGDDCANDYWASMTRWGREVQTGENWTGAVVVDPDPLGYTGQYYLDIQYVEDRDAGAVVYNTDPLPELGSAQWDPIKWFRMTCFEPQPRPPIPVFTPAWINDPWGTPMGVQKDTTLTIENNGGMDFVYSITIEEDNGPEGWLAVSGFSGTVPWGLNNIEEGTIHLNYNGVIVDYGWYYGRLIFEGNWDTSPYSVEIALWVGPEPPQPTWDTVHTSCLSLIASNNGNMGRAGHGGVNMDYLDDGECDLVRGNIYLYEGSTIVGRLDEGNPKFFYSMWGSSTLDSTALWPLPGGEIWTVPCEALDDAEFFQTGYFVTRDSTIGMTKAYVAPATDCPWIIEYTKFFSYDGEIHEGIIVGEAIDWDVPWDYHDDDEEQSVCCVNSGGIDYTLAMTYQRGYESALDTNDCQQNTDRYAGNAFVTAFYNGVQQPYPYCGAIVDNDQTQGPDGFLAQALYDEMTYAGFRGTDSVSDLHTLMTFHPSLTLDADDEYEVVCVLATVHEGEYADLQAAVNNAKAWYIAHGGIAMFADDDDNGKVDACESCCKLRGDVDNNGQIDAMDVVCMVDEFWGWGCYIPCWEHADVDGSNQQDAMDIVFLIDYIWGGGPTPPPCH